MTYVVPIPPVPSLATVGADPGARWPVRRIFCVGRNYVDHAIEMGGSGRERPFFFMKPADAVLPVEDGAVGHMHYPSLTRDLHHEVELVVAIGQGGRDIPASQAMNHVWGYAVGLDMTRRDLQAEAKAQGRPWCIAKGFDEAAPIGPVRPAAQCYLTAATKITLKVNGAQRQHSVLGKMIWSVPEIIEQLSAAWDLAPGDLIYTGTPEGVAQVAEGDTMSASIEGVGSLRVQVVLR
jgi:fumarylpyruvate hydrolase